MEENIFSPKQKPEPDSYMGVVEGIIELYEGKISQKEAHEAARNLVNFFQILLEISKKKE
ncbi:hypothetical protein [Emticicia fontis]